MQVGLWLAEDAGSAESRQRRKLKLITAIIRFGETVSKTDSLSLSVLFSLSPASAPQVGQAWPAEPKLIKSALVRLSLITRTQRRLLTNDYWRLAHG